MSEAEVLLTAVFADALAAADPYDAVARHGDELLSRYEKGGFTRLYVLAFGKAVAPMLRAITDRMGEKLTGGIAITKHGYRVDCKSDRIAVHEAGHPLPDEAGLKATMEAMKLARTFDEKTLLVCLISGGGSALLVAPYTGITLAEKQKTTDLLLKAGADINDLNAVRKHASMVKGGRLAEIAYPATVESMILSDVMGDPLDVIASGPTAPDSTTYADALKVIEKFGLADKAPPAILSLFREGAAGRVAETPKQGNPVFDKVRNTIVANNRAAIEAAQWKAGRLGFTARVLSTNVSGEAADMGRRLAAQARAARAGAQAAGGRAPLPDLGRGDDRNGQGPRARRPQHGAGPCFRPRGGRRGGDSPFIGRHGRERRSLQMRRAPTWTARPRYARAPPGSTRRNTWPTTTLTISSKRRAACSVPGPRAPT